MEGITQAGTYVTAAGERLWYVVGAVGMLAGALVMLAMLRGKPKDSEPHHVAHLNGQRLGGQHAARLPQLQQRQQPARYARLKAQPKRAPGRRHLHRIGARSGSVQAHPGRASSSWPGLALYFQHLPQLELARPVGAANSLKGRRVPAHAYRPQGRQVGHGQTFA